jgi:hypothetical protein
VAYFVFCILLGTMVTLNLLFGVTVNGMEEARGAADCSYGIQIARVAGLPLSVVDRARRCAT